MASSMKNRFKRQTPKEPKSVQLDEVLYKWFIAMCSKANPMTGPITDMTGPITEKVKSL
jgi:hypothetical protein